MALGASIAELLVVINGESAGLTRALGQGEAGLTTFGAAAEKSQGRLGSFASGIQKVGEVVAGLGLLVAGVSVKMAADFETKMMLIRTQAHDTEDNLQSMGQAVLKMSTEVGISAEKLADGLYHVTSVGYRGAAALDILKVAAEGARVGNADLDATTYALTSTMNTYGLGAKDAAATMATLNAIVGAGDMRFQDLNAAISTGFLAAGETFGVTIQSMGAALAYLTDRGASADESATRLKMSINLLGAPTSKAVGILKDLGLSAEEATGRATAMEEALKKSGVTTTQLSADLRKPDGIQVALTDLVDHMHKGGLSADEMAAVLSRAFGGGRSGAAIMSMVQHLDILGAKFKAVNDGASRFAKDWEDTQKTFNVQFDRLKMSLEAVVITLGGKLLPILTPIVKWISDAATSTNGWVQGLIAFASGAGLVLVILSGIVAVLPFLTAGLEVMLGPIGLAIAAFVLGAVVIQRNWGTIAPFFENISSRIGSAFGAIASQIRTALDRIQDGWNRLASGGSGAQAFFQALTGIKPSTGGLGPQENARTAGRGAPSGGQVDYQESAAALRGNRGPGTPLSDMLPGRQAPRPGSEAEAEKFTQRALSPVLRPEQVFAAQQRAPGMQGAGPSGMGTAGIPLGAQRGEQGTPGLPGATGGGGAPTGPAMIANTLGPMLDKAIDLFGRLGKAWDEVVRGFKNGASPLTILIGVLMDLGMSGDRVVAIAHFLEAAWGVLSKAWSAFAGFIGPMLVKLFKEGIEPAVADLRKNLGPLGKEFSEAWASVRPIVLPVLQVLAIVLGVIAAVIGALLAGALKGLLAALTVALPLAVHFVIDLFHILADVIKIFGDIIRGDWGGLVRDLLALGGHLLDAMVTLWRLLFDTVMAAMRGFTDGVVNFFLWLWHMLVGGSIVPDMVHGIIGWFTNLATTVFNVVDGWVNNLIKRFTDLKDGLLGMAKQIASGLIDFFAGGINQVLALFRGFLGALSKIPGVGALVDKADQVLAPIDPGGLKKAIGLATGGMITNGPHYIVGEGNPAYPEVVLPTDPSHRGRAMDLLGWFTKAVGLAGGGVMGNPYPPGECTTYVWSRFPGMPVNGNATDWGSLPLQHSSSPAPGEIVVYHAGPGYSQYGHVAVVEEVLGDKFRVSEMNYVGHGVISSRISSMAGVETFLRPGVPGSGSPASGTSGGGFDFSALVDAALKAAQGGLGSVPPWIRGLAGNVLGKIADAAKAKLMSFAGGTLSGSVSGNHADWLHAAEKAAGVGADWDAGLSTIIQHESGWNPGARNNSDSNAQAGNASVGLMQLTGTNRARYDPDESPVGQIIGGIRYILARYGGINNVPGVRSVMSGGAYVPYDSGGVLMPGLTMALNNTGRPETVLPPGAGSHDALSAKLDLTNSLLYQILHDGGAPANGFTAALRSA